MLHGRKVPKFLWSEAVLATAQLRNRTCTAKNGDKTPFEIWHGKKPNIERLRVFGSICYEHVLKIKRRDKWDKKAEKGIFVGYQGSSDNYRVYDPER